MPSDLARPKHLGGAVQVRGVQQLRHAERRLEVGVAPRRRAVRAMRAHLSAGRGVGGRRGVRGEGRREELAEGAREVTAFMAGKNSLNGSHRTKSLRMGSMCGKFHPYNAFASIMSRNGDKIRC